MYFFFSRDISVFQNGTNRSNSHQPILFKKFNWDILEWNYIIICLEAQIWGGIKVYILLALSILVLLNSSTKNFSLFYVFCGIEPTPTKGKKLLSKREKFRFFFIKFLNLIDNMNYLFNYHGLNTKMCLLREYKFFCFYVLDFILRLSDCEKKFLLWFLAVKLLLSA